MLIINCNLCVRNGPEKNGTPGAIRRRDVWLRRTAGSVFGILTRSQSRCLRAFQRPTVFSPPSELSSTVESYRHKTATPLQGVKTPSRGRTKTIYLPRVFAATQYRFLTISHSFLTGRFLDDTFGVLQEGCASKRDVLKTLRNQSLFNQTINRPQETFHL